MSDLETDSTARVDRIFLLELNGSTIDLLRERANRLPNFGRLLERGAWGRLQGPLQPVSPLCHATLFTGMNPAKTGVFDYFLFPAGGYERIPYDRSALRAKPMFEVLSERGLRVGLLNALLLHPAPAVNGFSVAGDEGIGDDYARPEDVRRLLQARGYSVPFGASYKPGSESEFHGHVLKSIEMRRDAFRALFGKRPWDFGMLSLYELGELLHAFWRFYDSRHPHHRPVEEVFGGTDPLMKALLLLDELLGEILELAGPGGLVLVVGAWGHRLEHSRLYLNTWLQREGYLRLRRRPKVIVKRMISRSGFSLATAERFARRLGLWKLFHYGLPRGKRAAMKQAAFLSLADVDWRRTRAVATGYLGQIYLNVRGRRPAGAIDPADYEEERDGLRERLEGLRDPRTGEAVVDRVFCRDEIYAGPHLENAPDLVVHLKEGWSAHSNMDTSGPVVGESPLSQSSDHWNESVFLAWGQGIISGEVRARLEDIAPTVLSAVGIPVPPDCDGEPLPIFD